VILSLIFDIVSMVLGHIRDFFVTIWNAVSETVTTVFSAIWEVISSVLSTIWGYISAVMSTIFEGWSIAWGWIKDTVSGVWDVIWGKIVDITEKVQGTISRWFDKVKGVFSTALSSIRHLWDSAWKWVHEKIVTWGDRIAGIGTSIKDRIVSAIRSIPSGIISAINGMIDLVNSAIRTVNKIIPDKMDIPELGHVKLPKFAGGGLIRGPGTGTSDSIPLMTSMGPIMGSNGEFMIRARSTRGLMEDFGPGFLDWLNAYDVKRGDPSALAISPRRYAEGGLITRTQDWIRAQDPKPKPLPAVLHDVHAPRRGRFQARTRPVHHRAEQGARGGQLRRAAVRGCKPCRRGPRRQRGDQRGRHARPVPPARDG
jgi:hypothetical protein